MVGWRLYKDAFDPDVKKNKYNVDYIIAIITFFFLTNKSYDVDKDHQQTKGIHLLFVLADHD